MLRIEVVREASPNVRFSPPVPPARHTMPTVPCDLSEYALAETGPLSWSARDDDPRACFELDDDEVEAALPRE